MFSRFSKLSLFFVFIACIFSVEAVAVERAPIKHVVEELKTYVAKYRDLFQTPGMAFVIVKDGDVFIETFGTAALDDATPVDGDTVFQVASVTKNFTATLIMRLVDKGLLSLDDKVSTYLPDFILSDAKARDDLRVRDLLTHATGIGNFSGDSFWHSGMSQDEVIKAMRDIPFEHPFRSKYGYSNIMVGVAGCLIEKATGKPLSKVMEEEIFHPLNMHSSSLGYEAATKKPSMMERLLNFLKGGKQFTHAKHHNLYKGKVHQIDTTPEFFLFPGTSGVNTTPHDMAKWLLFHLGSQSTNGETSKGETLLSKNAIALMRTPYTDASDILGLQFPKDRMHKVDIGLGWFMGDFGVEGNRAHILNQMGGTGGVRALISIIPKENFGIAVLCNLGGMRSSLFPEGIVQKCLDLYMKNPGRDYAKDIHEKFLKNKNQSKLYVDAARLQNPQPPSALSTYEGIYKNKLYGTAKITLSSDKKLQLHYRGKTAVLEHLNGHQFLSDGEHVGEGFESDDLCFVDFGLNPGDKKAYGLMISLLNEGENPAFYTENTASLERSK